MTQRFHTLTGLACSLLAIVSAPAVWGILVLCVEGSYGEPEAQAAQASAGGSVVEAEVAAVELEPSPELTADLEALQPQ